ncbi:MAG: di-heme oxidoredictase family protein [Rhizobiaceae bacterium]
MKQAIISCLILFSLLADSTASAGEPIWEEKTEALGAITTMPSGTLSSAQLKTLTQIGLDLFTAKFTRLDGAGRPAATQAIIPTKARHKATQAFSRLAGPDSLACSSCHNDPVVGGAGDFITNVFVSEGFTNANFDTTDPQFSNERGTNHLFGAGLLELLAREMSNELAALRSKALNQAARNNAPVKILLITKGVSFGSITAMPDGLVDLKHVEGVDTDLVIRPFSQKGVMASLRQFTINAMNHHHGMQASERYGDRWTGNKDFDEDTHNDELTPTDISALVAWQATLRPPIAKKPSSKNWQQAAAKGEHVFNEYGCATCHMKSLPLSSLTFQDPGSFDVSGTLNSMAVKTPASYDLNKLAWAKQLPRNDKGEVLVPLFGDLKRHKMTDRTVAILGNELLSQRFVGRDIFMTAELWGIGSTSPYGHRNDFTTLEGIILAHGGEGRDARDAYKAAPKEERSSLIAYLKTLVIK